MKKTNKKGFTIVELVIVIAVVAILAAVLIPTFVSVVNKANVSNDTALVRNLNTVLATEGIDGKNVTMSDAIADAEKGGYTVEKLTPRSSGDILWDSENDRFVLVDGNGNFVAGEDSAKSVLSGDKSKLWKINHASEAISNEYSNYLAEDFMGTVGNIETGLDVGAHIDINNISYNRSSATDKRETIICTNNGVLTINAEKDEVRHYGVIEELNIISVNSENCYHEFGTVVELKSFGSGKFVAEDSAVFVQSKATIENILSGKTFELKEGVKYGEMSPVAKSVAPADFVETVANGGHFTLTEDATISDTINVKAGKEVIIDLKDKKLVSSSDSYTIVVEAGATLHINGGYFSNLSNPYASLIRNLGTLIIENGTFLSQGSTVVKNECNANLTINGGNFIVDKKQDNGYFFNAILNYGTATINDGYFTANGGSALWNTTYTGGSEITVAEATINGGTFVSTAEEPHFSPSIGALHNDDAKMSINGGDFTGVGAGVVNDIDYVELALDIYSGNFTCVDDNNGYALCNLNGVSNVYGGVFNGTYCFIRGTNVVVMGGTFGTNPSNRDVEFDETIYKAEQDASTGMWIVTKR